MKFKNPVSQNIRIFPKINKKKGFAKQKISSSLKSMFIYALNTWSGLLSTNSSISEEWHGSDQPVALLRHYWAFSSSLLLDPLFLILLLKIFHRFHMGFRSGMLAGQSSTVISWSANHLEVVWLCGQVLKSIKLVSRWKHKVLQNIL